MAQRLLSLIYLFILPLSTISCYYKSSLIELLDIEISIKP